MLLLCHALASFKCFLCAFFQTVSTPQKNLVHLKQMNKSVILVPFINENHKCCQGRIYHMTQQHSARGTALRGNGNENPAQSFSIFLFFNLYSYLAGKCSENLAMIFRLRRFIFPESKKTGASRNVNAALELLILAYKPDAFLLLSNKIQAVERNSRLRYKTKTKRCAFN